MKQLNPDWVRLTLETINGCPHFQLQSMTIVALEYGTSLIEIDVQTKHLQPFGLVHGGVYATLLDATGWWAAYSQADESLGMTTVEMKLNYLAPVADGLMIGRGRCIKLGKNIGLAEATLEKPGWPPPGPRHRYGYGPA